MVRYYLPEILFFTRISCMQLISHGTIPYISLFMLKRYYFHRILEYLHDNLDISVYERTSKTYSAKEVTDILLDVNLSTIRIATKQPVSVQENLVFIVDLSHLEKPEDVRADDLGSWASMVNRL